jgi:hypothetical protein
MKVQASKIVQKTIAEYLTHEELFCRRFVNSSAQDNMAVDGTLTPQTFFVQAPDSAGVIIKRIQFYLTGADRFDDAKFGGITALTNGVEIAVDGTLIATYKDNMDILLQSGECTAAGVIFSKTTNALQAVMDFERIGIGGVFLPKGQQATITINDRLTLLTYFKAQAKGLIVW